ncbi:MAG: cytidylate kinase family protein [Anaerovoracaceae bacterium]
MKSFVITIARGTAAAADRSKALAKQLGIKYYDRDLIRIASEDSGINEALFNLADRRAAAILSKNITRRKLSHLTATSSSRGKISSICRPRS